MKPTDITAQTVLTIHDLSDHLDEPVNADHYYQITLTHKARGRESHTVKPGPKGFLISISEQKPISRIEYDIEGVETV